MIDQSTELPLSVAGESSPTVLTLALPDSQAARHGRVLDYLAESLEKPDALRANLGSLNSGLMHVALNLDTTIVQALESGPRTIERLQKILPAIETHLRVTRQVDRFAQIEIRAAEIRQPKPDLDEVARLAAPLTPESEENAS